MQLSGRENDKRRRGKNKQDEVGPLSDIAKPLPDWYLSKVGDTIGGAERIKGKGADITLHFIPPDFILTHHESVMFISYA